MLYNRKIKPSPHHDEGLVLIYPISFAGQKADVDFYILLSFLKLKGIRFRWLNYEWNSGDNDYTRRFAGEIKDVPVYLYIPDITYFSGLRDLLDILKKKGCLIITGGFPTLTAMAAEILGCFDAIDIFVRAPEPEKVLVGLLKGLHENLELESIEGITFRQYHTCKIKTNPSPPLSKSLDYLDKLEFLEQECSSSEWYPLVSSRGCNGNCQYCGLQVPYRFYHPQDINSQRTRPFVKIVDEIERLMSKGVDKFRFYCEQFLDPKETACPGNNVTAIANEILKRGLKPGLAFTAKAVDLNRNFACLFLLKEAGLEMVNIGIDSGLDRFHQIYETGSSVEDNFKILEKMHQYNFNFEIDFVFFDPYLSVAEIEQNLSFLEMVSDYFSHLPGPYSDYLDSGILNSTLTLRHGMPIIQKLQHDNLVIDSSDFSSHPSFVFKDSWVDTVYSVYRIIRKTVIPSVRHFYNNRLAIENKPFLNLFPLEIMRKIVNDVTAGDVRSIPHYVLDTASFIKSKLGRT